MIKRGTGLGRGIFYSSGALFFIFLLCQPLVRTASAEEKKVSLKEALQYGLHGNPEIKAAETELLASHEEIGIAASNLLPKISFEERFTRTDNPTYAFMAKLNQKRFAERDFAISSLNNPTPVNDFQSALSLEQPLFAPKARAGIEIAENDFSSRKYEFGRKKEELVLNIFKAVLNVQTSKAFVGVAETGRADALEHLRIAEERYKTGMGLYSDTLRAKVALAAAEERLVSSAKDLDVTKKALGLMLGLSESVDVTGERPSLSVKGIEYYNAVSGYRADLKSVALRSRNAESSLRIANAGYLPVVGVGASYQMNDHKVPLGAEGDSWTVAAFLRWEIFDGTKREHERAKAKLNIRAAEEHLDGLRKAVSFQVYQAYLELTEAKERLELAGAALESAQEGTRLVQKRYENSLAPMLDLLDSQASLDSTRAEAVMRDGAYLAAVANLYFQSGTILTELGVQ